MKGNGSKLGCVDQTQIASELEAAERGRTCGEENLPSTDAAGPCVNEKYFKRHHESFLAKKHRIFTERIQALDHQLSEILVRLDPSTLQEAWEIACQKVVETQTRLSKEIKKAVQYCKLCERQLASLKDRGHTVSSSAMGSYILVYGVLIAFLIVESLANSYFLGQGSIYGLMGGAIEAFFIASLSIALSFTAGIGVRALYGNNLLRRTAAIVAAMICISAMGGYHLMIGWYRASLVYGNPETAVADALANFFHHKLALPDLYSYGLMLVGLFFAGTAFVAGLKAKDARQAAANARVARNYENAKADHQNLEQEYLGCIRQSYVEQLDEVDKREKAAFEAGHQLRLTVQQSRRLMHEYDNCISGIRDSYNYCVAVFRRSNEVVRNSQSPAYFRHDPVVLDDGVFVTDENSIKKAEQVLGHLEQRLELMRNTARMVKHKVRADYEATLKAAPGFLENLCAEGVADNEDHSVAGSDVADGEDEVPIKLVHSDFEKEGSHASAT